MADVYHDYTQKIDGEHDSNAIRQEDDVKQENSIEIEPQEEKFNNFTVPEIESKSIVVNNSFNQENNIMKRVSISSDHCYARPWNWKSESNFLRPTKTLFIPKISTQIRFPGQSGPVEREVDIENIDIESIDSDPTPIYDVNKAKQLMEECEKHIRLFKSDKGNDLWEEAILKHNWTPAQTRLFNGFVSILNNHQLAKLASTGANHEAICRRSAIDKSVQRVRRLMATVFWDQKLTHWLHQLLVDNLSTEYLAIYLDILQTLKAKLPTFVEKMIYGQNTFKMGVFSTENLLPMLKRPWDPVISSLMQDKPNKLPGNPVIIVVPSSHLTSNRYLKWVNLLSNLATVVTVPFNFGAPSQKLTTVHCADQMFAAVRSQVQEVKNEQPSRNVVLLGFNSGASLALQVAQVEPVFAVVCLGFSLLTAEGRRGEPDDGLVELQNPVLFIIGQCSTTASQEDMEDLRERMRIETGLVVVGSADNFLRVTKKKKRAEGITQSVVDRCIVDEIGEFISGLILSPFPPQIRQSPSAVTTSDSTKKTTTKERKRYNSNASSLDSEDQISPIPPRIARPVGRPPGSKTKSKLEVKWAAQVAQGNASSNENTSSCSSHSSTSSTASTVSAPPNLPVSPKPPVTPPPPPNTVHSLPQASSNSDTDDLRAPSLPSGKESPAASVFAGGDATTAKRAPPLISCSFSKIKTLLPFKSDSLDGHHHQRAKMNRDADGGAAGGKLNVMSATGVRKVKTLRPQKGAAQVEGAKISPLKISPVKANSAKMQAYGMVKHNVVSGSRLSTLLQGGIKTIPPTQPKNTIRVLENVTLTPAHSKMSTNASNKTLTVVNPIKSTSSNVILLPDGKIKTFGHANVIKSDGTRYITSKKQLIANNSNKPPKHMKKVGGNFKAPPTTISTALPPPTNLTTQDIMDLPIIFADDNDEIIDAASLTDAAGVPPAPAPPTPVAAPAHAPSSVPKLLTPGSKFVLVNKPIMGLSSANTNFVISHTPVKKQQQHQTTAVYRQTPKYTKIILSKRAGPSAQGDESRGVISRIANLSPEISVKRVNNGNVSISTASVSSSSSVVHGMMENIDLENELVATTIPKPVFGGGEIKNVSMLHHHKVVSRQGDHFRIVEKIKEERLKREISPDEDDSDPDYVPPKMVRLN